MDAGEWRLSQPSDVELHRQDEAARELFDLAMGAAAESGGQFIDTQFRACASSLDGRRGASAGAADVRCSCGTKAKLCTVSKAGRTEGRNFWGCRKPKEQRCGFFQWADNAPHADADVKAEWRRIGRGGAAAVVKVRQKDGAALFSPDDVVQGRVGDCWFLAAIATVAERPDLLRRNVVTQESNAAGCYQMRLFIDGRWRVYTIDDFVPGVRVKATKKALQGEGARYASSSGRPADGAGGSRPAPPAEDSAIDAGGDAAPAPPPARVDDGMLWQPKFAKARHGELWVPLLEKAYAKAHGSYSAISGGWPAEALFDLTGCPTETFGFEARRFDPEVFWATLLSYKDQRFLMAASCYATHKGSGIVPGHAYSILDVRDLEGVEGVTISRQSGIQEFFRASGPSAKSGSECAALGERKARRLVKLRNPWGRREWSGSFSAKSDEWNAALRELLGATRRDDGTFWMPYAHFLAHFQVVDVCKAHDGWYSACEAMRIAPRRVEADAALQVEVEGARDAWTYITIAQATKRGKRSARYYYADVSVCVCLLDALGEAERVVLMRLNGHGKASHCDLHLRAGRRYAVFAFSCGRAQALESRAPAPPKSTMGPDLARDVRFSLRLFSARPLRTRRAAPDPAALRRALHMAFAQQDVDGCHRAQRPCGNGGGLAVLEGSGAALAMVANPSASMHLNAQFLLHGCGAGASNAGGAGAEPPVYAIAPGTQAIVAAVSSVPDQDYERRGEGSRAGAFVVDALQMWETYAAAGGLAAAAAEGDRRLFAAEGPPLLAFPRQPAPRPRAALAMDEESEVQRAIEESLREAKRPRVVDLVGAEGSASEGGKAAAGAPQVIEILD